MAKKIYLSSPDPRLVASQLSLNYVNSKSCFVEISDYTPEGNHNREFGIFMDKAVRFRFRFIYRDNVWLCTETDFYYPNTNSKELTEKQEQKLLDIIKPLVETETKKKENIKLAYEAGVEQQTEIYARSMKNMQEQEANYQNAVKNHQNESMTLAFMQLELNKL